MLRHKIPVFSCHPGKKRNRLQINALPPPPVPFPLPLWTAPEYYPLILRLKKTFEWTLIRLTFFCLEKVKM